MVERMGLAPRIGVDVELVAVLVEAVDRGCDAGRGADGTLRLRGVELATWQALELPRKWDDSERRPDKALDARLIAMMERLKTAIGVWTEVLDHMSPAN